MANAGWARLGQAVRARRERLGLTQEDVTEQGGPSHQTLRNVERGKAGPYQSRTIAQLERVLGWRPGIAMAIVAGEAPDNPVEWLSAEAPAAVAPYQQQVVAEPVDNAPSQLRALLLGAGVGIRWRLRQLERYSRGRVTRDEWQSMLEDNELWPEDKLLAVQETLNGLGVTVTLQELEQAMSADRRHTSAIPRDELAELSRRVDELSKKIQELTTSQVADRSTGRPSQSSRTRGDDHN